MRVAKFEARFKSLIIGQRFKRTVYRPCLETIPSSTINGFFRENFGISNANGVGILHSGTYRRTRTVISLSDKALHSAILPIEAEYLAPVGAEIQASVYVAWDRQEAVFVSIQNALVIMGGWRYKGFGRGILSFRGILEAPINRVSMKTRVTKEAAKALGIQKIIAPVFGYLFEPTAPLTGHWVPSLFEGSVVEGPDFLGTRYLYDI